MTAGLRPLRVRATIVAFAVALCLLGSVIGPEPATARLRETAAAATQDATGAITLVGQTAVRRPGEPFAATVRVRTSSPTAGLEVAIGTYRRLRSRSEFTNAIEGRLPNRTPTDLLVTPVDALATNGDGDATITLTPGMTQEGVYPVRVELREDEGEVIDGFTTFLVSVPTVVDADPIDVALFVPFHAPPSVQPNGMVTMDARRRESLVETASVLAARPDVALSLLPTPETLEALKESDDAASRNAVAALAGAINGRDVLASTYVEADIPALATAGLPSEIAAQHARAVAVVSGTLARTPTLDIRRVHAPLDARAISLLADDAVDHLVVDEADLEPIRLPNGVTLTSTFEIGATGVPAAVADAGVARHFDRDVSPALGAAHLLADLSVLWLDRPGTAASRRGVVVSPPLGWDPNPAFLDAVLAGLAANPVLDAVTIEEFFDEVGPLVERREVVQRSFVTSDVRASVPTGPIRRTRSRVESYASLVSTSTEAGEDTAAGPNADAAPGAAAEVDLLRRRLLVSQTSGLVRTQRLAYLDAIGTTIDRRVQSITMPERRSITLTAREGELPVTVTSGLPAPVEVVVTLESDTLDFPGGATRRLRLDGENTTERFEVHAKGSGSFPVRVTVRSPDGELLIAESRFTVRSTAVSGVGVALSVGAMLFIVVWWASHLRSRPRRRSEPAPA